MRIALAQMNSSANIRDNLRQVHEYFQQAAVKKAHLLVLPENCLAMAIEPSVMAAMDWQDCIQQLQQWCRHYRLACVAGSMPLPSHNSDPRRLAASLFINDLGELLAQYNKLHFQHPQY